jgi:hypothetical protein
MLKAINRDSAQWQPATGRLVTRSSRTKTALSPAAATRAQRLNHARLLILLLGVVVVMLATGCGSSPATPLLTAPASSPVSQASPSPSPSPAPAAPASPAAPPAQAPPSPQQTTQPVAAPPAPPSGAWCSATASVYYAKYNWNNVYVNSNQPYTDATASADGFSWSYETNGSGYAEIYLNGPPPGAEITVTIDGATCYTSD